MKTPGMTGKEIILRYLETHARFSAPELVEKLGVKRTVINQAAGKMVREGLLVVDGYTDKITHYRKPTEKERQELAQRAEQQQEKSVIEACKRSEIMKRILFIYGVHSVKGAGESGQKFFLPRRSSRQAKRVRNAATVVQAHTGDLPGTWHQQETSPYCDRSGRRG